MKDTTLGTACTVLRTSNGKAEVVVEGEEVLIEAFHFIPQFTSPPSLQVNQIAGLHLAPVGHAIHLITFLCVEVNGGRGNNI